MPRKATEKQRAASAGNGKKGGRPRAPSKHEQYEAVGPPPEDPLALPGWCQRLLAVAMHNVATDQRMPEARRRQELRATGGTIARLTPIERIRKATKLIEADRKKLEDVGGGELEE